MQRPAHFREGDGVNRWALAMPLAALAIVGLAAAAVFASRQRAEPQAPAPLARDDIRETPAARLPSDVCKGILSPPAPGEERVFSSHYVAVREVNGIAIVGGAGVSEAAFEAAEETVRRMFADNDLEEPLAAAQAYIIIADEDEGILDLPEFGCLEQTVGSNFFTHVCGIADRADYPVATVNEADLVGDRRGPCSGLNILYHELGHLVQAWALPPPDYFQVKLLYQEAIDAGKYRGDYASTNPNEYWADGTQAYFLSADAQGRRDRDWLRRYDPALYELLAATYGDE